MHIGTRQGTAQLDRRDSKVVTVHRACQIFKACASSIELSDRNRRNQNDTRARLDIKPQVIRKQGSVLFAAHQCKLRFCFKKIHGIQLQAEGIKLPALEGINLALHLRKLQSYQAGSIEFARSMDTVDLKLMLLI